MFLIEMSELNEINMKQENVLQQIQSPDDLRKLSREDLPQLAQELRAFILDSVSSTGGHLSSNLGTVELTIALHYAFKTPDDRLIWDVGHQSYAHKILTGRRELMHTLRKLGGISGFPPAAASRCAGKCRPAAAHRRPGRAAIAGRRHRNAALGRPG